MKHVKLLVVALLIVALVGVFIGCTPKEMSPTKNPEKKIKVAFIYNGPHND